MRRPSILLGLSTILAAGLAAASCGGGGGSSGAGAVGDLQLTGISVPANAVWQINRPIEFTFNQPIDFSTVGPNTINIQTTTGVPANGVFSIKRVDTDGDGIRETTLPSVVVFQPTCPTRADSSDAGLMLPSVSYVITVVGRSSNAPDTVESTNGARLQETQTRRFVTPVSTDPTTAFLDLVSGPPQPVVREVGSTRTEGVTYFEIGGDPDDRVFVEFDEQTQTYTLSDATFRAPLNLYSDPRSRIAAVVVFNQPVSPLESNIDQNFIRLETQDSLGNWQPFETNVTLVANCTEAGATVRLEPVGILPVASAVRAVVNPGFSDLTGQQDNALPLDRFAVSPTSIVAFSSLSPAEVGADEIFEGFTFGGDAAGSREDVMAIFDTPAADWGGGALAAGFTFAGTGGPNGNFDWVIRDGQVAFLNTVSDQIVGGENGAPEAIQNVVGGVVDVRNLIIEEGGLLRVQGANTLCINASGQVIIRGTLDVSGGNAKDVSSLDTGNQPEPGGVGNAGGGRGGTGSWVTNNSTPVGMTGFGPFEAPNEGGKGGETSFQTGNPNNVNNRRPGGGGGGRFAPDLPDSEYAPGPDAIVLPSTNSDSNPEVFGLKAQPGFDGNANALGAVDGMAPPNGGQPGAGPFTDSDEDNNFWGTRAILDPDTLVTTFIRGELTDINPGYGGGAGGDASTAASFPTPDWTIASDEKGGGGGGGGGAVHVKALGKIIFGQAGQILCRGGKGGTGENTNFLDHVGGGGGGGSGGHVVLETASEIDFTDGQPNLDWGTNPFLMDDGMPFTGGRPRILANGGDGATIGQNADGDGNTNPPALGYGGDGGPGVVQLHVPNSTQRPSTNFPNPTDIIVPLQTAVLEDEDYQDMLRSIMAPGGIPMVPTFGARSRARSDWITLGAADQGAGGVANQVLFYFGGLNGAGEIDAVDGKVQEVAPILDALVDGNVSVNAAGDAMTLSSAALDPLVNDASTLSNDVYLRTPNLLENFGLRLLVDGSPNIMRTFDVVSASYDDAMVQLTLVVDVGLLGNTIQRFLDDNSGSAIRYQLVPRFFRVVTGGVEDFIGDDATVTISFQWAPADSFGNPDESNLDPFTSDLSTFNSQAAGTIQFVRFEVGFDLAGTSELTVDTQTTTLDFLRLPFRF